LKKDDKKEEKTDENSSQGVSRFLFKKRTFVKPVSEYQKDRTAMNSLVHQTARDVATGYYPIDEPVAAKLVAYHKNLHETKTLGLVSTIPLSSFGSHDVFANVSIWECPPNLLVGKHKITVKQFNKSVEKEKSIIEKEKKENRTPRLFTRGMSNWNFWWQLLFGGPRPCGHQQTISRGAVLGH